MEKGEGPRPHLGFLLLRLRAISLTQAGWVMTRLKPDWGERKGQLLQADPQDCQHCRIQSLRHWQGSCLLVSLPSGLGSSL